jgi:hypothetical protein
MFCIAPFFWNSTLLFAFLAEFNPAIFWGSSLIRHYLRHSVLVLMESTPMAGCGQQF